MKREAVAKAKEGAERAEAEKRLKELGKMFPEISSIWLRPTARKTTGSS